MTDSSPLSRTSAAAPEGTRLALLTAALHLFGRQGFSATSTRQIAAMAQTNVASIAYHFDGKDGLRLACAHEFCRRIGAVMQHSGAMPQGVQAARAGLRASLQRMVEFMVGSEEAGELVPFMLREISEDGPGVDLIYAALMEPAHQRFCGLWAQVTGQLPDSDGVKLAVFSMIGQVLYFRIGAKVIDRRMGWSAIGAAEIAAISAQLLHNMEAVLAAAAKEA